MLKNISFLTVFVFLGVILSGCSQSGEVSQEPSESEIVQEDNGQMIREFIEGMYPQDEQRQSIAHNYVKVLQGILEEEDLNNVDIDEYLRASDCLSFNMMSGDVPVIDMVVFDSIEKLEKYEEFNALQSGKFFTSDLENLNCEF